MRRQLKPANRKPSSGLFSVLVGPLTLVGAALACTANISCAASSNTGAKSAGASSATGSAGQATSNDASLQSQALSSSESKFAEPSSNKNGSDVVAASSRTQSPVALRYDRGKTPWLGVELRATEEGKAGVEIVRVLPGSPAEAAELQAGDILMRLGEESATSPSNVSDWVRAQKPGESHPISVMRAGKPHLVRAQLDGMPEFEDRLRLAFVGKPAPEITGVVTFQGEAASLRELRGQVVVLEFWASFCGVCRFLAPILDGWQRIYQPQGAQVIGITPDTPQKGLEVARQTGMGYTLASDPDAEITRDYLASQIPTIIILDRKGIVHDVIVGYSKARLQEAEALIEKLLAERI